MGRYTPIIAPAAVAVVVAAAVGLSSPDAADSAHKRAATERSNASVELTECAQGRRRRDRRAAFRGEMAQVPGVDRMRMRFQLFERIERGAWRPVRAPGLGTWHASRPGVPGFAYVQRVVGLDRATVYRARVAFRWHGADGALVAHEDHRSRACRQRGRRPNLTLGRRVLVRPGPVVDAARYGVLVINDGEGVARRIRVLLRVDGADIATRAIRPLQPQRRRVARLLGPACTEEVEVVVDPADAVRETSEEDNVLSVVCPPAE
ncbi:MAG: CARDB domain-containing protein [Thermoleophilaceae bacterium]